MSVDERITTILVDTCAFRDANSDFIGISSMLLPSFFSVIKEKDILLLTHPILEREIEKHIEDSGIYKDYQSLVSHINKCKDVLRYANCCDEELFSKIADYNIKNQTFRAYKKYYKNAVKLDYPNPELIFELYFLSKPPFASTGKKKCEFPDAFVIEATKQYINEHPNDVLLVVSKDNDWVKSFWGVDNVIMCESIVEAIKNAFDNIVKGIVPLKGGKDKKQAAVELLSTNYYYFMYNVVYQGDTLSSMSEGKKAFVILRLLLDFDENKYPILIDQPEDDLDNRAIYNDLVTYIRNKKLERQIILVTHNPNITVGTDAEEIIVANQHGAHTENQDGVKFEYRSGAIENSYKRDGTKTVLLSQGIREHVCDLLEGGDIAFKKRESKYGLKK